MSTISKVAERAGVSRTTVSHVINHAERVSEPLRRRVEEAIDALGYRPNPQAQSLRTGRTNLVAVLIPDIQNPFYPELVKVIQSELEKAKLDTLVFNTDVPGGHSVEHGREYLRQIQHKRIDGLIIADFAIHWMHEDLRHLEIPAVFMGHLPNSAIDSVGFDDYGGCYAMGALSGRAGSPARGARHRAELLRAGRRAAGRLRAGLCRARRCRLTRRCDSKGPTWCRPAIRRSSGCSRRTRGNMPSGDLLRQLPDGAGRACRSLRPQHRVAARHRARHLRRLRTPRICAAAADARRLQAVRCLP